MTGVQSQELKILHAIGLLDGELPQDTDRSVLTRSKFYTLDQHLYRITPHDPQGYDIYGRGVVYKIHPHAPATRTGTTCRLGQPRDIAGAIAWIGAQHFLSFDVFSINAVEINLEHPTLQHHVE